MIAIAHTTALHRLIAQRLLAGEHPAGILCAVGCRPISLRVAAKLSGIPINPARPPKLWNQPPRPPWKPRVGWRKWFDSRFGAGAADRFIARCLQKPYRKVSADFGRQWFWAYLVYKGLTSGAKKPYPSRRPDVTRETISALARRHRSRGIIAKKLHTSPHTLKARAERFGVLLPDGRKTHWHRRRNKTARSRQGRTR